MNVQFHEERLGSVPTKAQLKILAKQMKETKGISLSRCYEALAKDFGFRNWNVLRALIKAKHKE